MGKIVHPLHEKVAEVIFDIGSKYGFDILVDTDCRFSRYTGIDQRLPFFLSYRPARESEVSNVDVVIMKEGKIKLVCEIEESGFNPTKIFGKLFSTASAKICKLSSGDFYELDKDAVFIQIISTSKLPDFSLKEKQGQLIENEIHHKLKLYNSWIKEYRLIYGEKSDFDGRGKNGYDEIERIIKFL